MVLDLLQEPMMELIVIIRIMKRYIVILVVIFCFSFEEKQRTQPFLEIEKKYDSVLSLNSEYINSTIFKFHNILSKENGSSLDSLLIDDYKSLQGNDSLIDFYITERINTINFNSYKIDVLKKYKGKYLLKKVYNSKYAEATNILISNDSCFIFKGKNLVVADKIKLINSSNEFVNGRFRIKNYNIGLAKFSQHKFITLKDNS
jgi:hypothetical protein